MLTGRDNVGDRKQPLSWRTKGRGRWLHAERKVHLFLLSSSSQECLNKSPPSKFQLDDAMSFQEASFPFRHQDGSHVVFLKCQATTADKKYEQLTSALLLLFLMHIMGTHIFSMLFVSDQILCRTVMTTLAPTAWPALSVNFVLQETGLCAKRTSKCRGMPGTECAILTAC